MTSPSSSTKVLLVADRRPSPVAGGAPALRRYRLAKLNPQSRSSEPHARFEYLKRVYE